MKQIEMNGLSLSLTAAAVLLALSGCGSSDSSTTTTTTPTSTVTATSTATATDTTAMLKGTVATGAPCEGGSVTARNSSGVAATAPVTVAADGTFQDLIVAMGSPYLLQATGCLGDRAQSIYSYLESDSSTPTVNITTLTDTALKMAANASSLDSIWSSWNSAAKPFEMDRVTLAQQKLIEQLQTAGTFDSNTFSNIDIFSTPFTPNGQGIDMVMDSLSTITVSNGTLTMNVNGHPISYALPADVTGTMQEHAGSSTCVADLTMAMTTPIAMTFPYTVCYTNIEADACNVNLEAQVKESMASIAATSPGASLTVNSYGAAAACPANTTVTVDFVTGTVGMGNLGTNIPSM